MSHAFKVSILDHGSDSMFRNLVDTLVNQRHVMMELVEMAWPRFPRLLTIVGGTSLNMREAYLPGEAGADSIQAFMQLPNRADENVMVQGDSHPPSDDNVTVVQGANGADIQVSLTSTSSGPELEMPDIQVAKPAVTLASTSSVPIPNLPTWRWAQNSCSLDATLYVVLRICETLPNHVSHCVDSADQSFQVFHSHYLHLQGPWTNREMTKARDAVRATLASGLGASPLIISGTSTLDGLVMRLIPARLRDLTTTYKYECQSKSCIDKVNSDPDKFDRVQRRDGHPDYLIYPAKFQKNSDTQTLLSKVVRNPPSPR
jgi:hypothetical protein